MGINFRELAQYTDSTSKPFAVWWLKSKNAMPLILFYACNCREPWSFAKNVKVKYSWTFLDLQYIASCYVVAMYNLANDYGHYTIRVESGSGDPDHLGHLGHLLEGQVGLILKLNYLDVTRISHVL